MASHAGSPLQAPLQDGCFRPSLNRCVSNPAGIQGCCPVWPPKAVRDYSSSWGVVVGLILATNTSGTRREEASQHLPCVLHHHPSAEMLWGLSLWYKEQTALASGQALGCGSQSWEHVSGFGQHPACWDLTSLHPGPAAAPVAMTGGGGEER